MTSTLTRPLNRTSLLVKDYGAVGDGSTNDYTALSNAITAAIAAGKRLEFETGKTYIVGTKLVISSALLVNGNGATIKKTAALNDWSLSVTGTSVELRDLNFHGNRAGGNSNVVGCLSWAAAGGKIRTCKATNGMNALFYVASGGVLDAYDCEATDTGGTGWGFAADSGGLLRTYNCRSDNHGHSGFYFVAGALAGCRLDGTANNNQFAGAWIETVNAGSCGRFVGDNNGTYGLWVAMANAAVTQITNWTFEYVETTNSGQALHGEYTPNASATGVNLFGLKLCSFGTIVSTNNLGYGLALTRGGTTPLGSLYNSFGDCTIEGCGDPAFFIGGASQFNTIASLHVRDCTTAVSLGEGTVGANNYNRFDFIHAIEVPFCVVRADIGSYNSFGRVIATDCTSGTGGYQSLVKWDTSGAIGNTIHHFESHNPTLTVPAYLMDCTSGAADNRILNCFCRTPPSTGLLLDAGTNNRVNLYGGTQALVQAANYTLVLNDLGTVIEGTKATAQTVTVPPNSSVAFPIGAVIQVVQYGAGQITLTAGAGVTLTQPTGKALTTRVQFSTVEIRKRATNEWLVSGDLT